MNIIYPNTSTNFDDVVSVLNNNSTVTIQFQLSPSTGLLVKKEVSKYVGYENQTVIEVSFYEDDASVFGRMSSGTEIHAADEALLVVRALKERLASTSPSDVSSISLARVW
ncbi:hypothetical protein EJP02_454 [Escherichia phage EJP2]|nr:hypothetical protein EJP02_454 [Escherichia phage EJP2]